MNVNRRLFYLFLAVILLLVMGAAYLARPARTAVSAAPQAYVPARDVYSSETAPSVDFTSMIQSPYEDLPSAQDIIERVPAPVPASGVGAVGSAPLFPPHAAVPAPAVSSAGAPSSARRSATPFAARGAARRKGRSAAGYTAPRVRSFGSAQTSGTDPYSAGGWHSAAKEEAQARADIFSPFTTQMTRREQTALNQKLQNFSVGLEQAIASAILPKSKREQNIEKYLSRARGEAAVMDGGVRGGQARQAGDGAQEVMQQLAAQSSGIVNDVRANYGDAAASEAQSIMNDFQAEMAETLNAPGDPQEKSIKAQAVNNKYNEKLRKLNNNAALAKMGEELRAQNEEYLKKIGETYGPQTETAMRPVLEEFADKRMQLLATPMSEEESVRQTLVLDEQLRKEQERIVKETAPEAAVGNLTALQNEQVKKRILEEVRKVEAGESFSPVYRENANALAQKEAAWKEDGKAIVKRFESLGPEAVAEAQRQMDSLLAYRRQLRQEAAEKGLSVAEVMHLDMKATEKANEALTQTGKQGMERLLNGQDEKQFEQMPEDFRAQLRPIWEKYNKQRAELSTQTIDQQTYQTRMQRLAEQKQQELQAAQQAYITAQQAAQPQ